MKIKTPFLLTAVFSLVFSGYALASPRGAYVFLGGGAAYLASIKLKLIIQDALRLVIILTQLRKILMLSGLKLGSTTLAQLNRQFIIIYQYLFSQPLFQSLPKKGPPPGQLI